MSDEEFEAASERITNLYRFESLDQAIAERDNINAKLAPGHVLEFTGATGVKRLAFTLHDLNASKLLKQQTKNLGLLAAARALIHQRQRL